MDPLQRAGVIERASTQIDLGRHEAALVHLDQALATSPEDPDLLELRALALLGLDRTTEALSAVQAATRVDPSSVRAHLVASMIHVQRRSPDEAVAAAQRTVNLAPGWAGGYQQLASAYVSTGADGPGAFEAASRALQIDPEDPDSHLAMVEALFPGGRNPGRARLKTAREHVERALELDPGNMRALNERARVQLAQRQFAGAAGTLSQAVAGSPQEQRLHDNMDIALEHHVSIVHWVLFLAYFVLARATDGYVRPWVAGLAAVSVVAIGVIIARLLSAVRTSRGAYIRGFARRRPLVAVWAVLLVISSLSFVVAALVPAVGPTMLVVASLALVAGAVLAWVVFFRDKRSGAR